MSSIKNKFALNIILIFSIFAIISAYFIQYILGHEPCNLCLIERVPYFAAVIFISLIFVFNKYEKKISLIVGLFFFFGSIISFYHFGIEQGFFSESLVCDLGANNTSISTQDLLKQLEKKTVSCKNATFKILGISLATFNTIFSFALSVIMIRIFRNYGKNK
mgnify:CR=1 FL=1